MQQLQFYDELLARQAIYDWYDVALSTLPVPYECHYIETRFGETHVLVTGNPDGAPLVLLHGMNNNGLIWRPQLAALQNYRVYAPDIVGHPGRSDGNRPSLAGGDYPRWLCDVLDALNLETVTLIGLSLGGYLTIKFGALMPHRVNKAILIAPAGLSPVRPLMGLRLVAANLPFRSHEEAINRVVKDIIDTPDITPKAMYEDIVALMRLIHRHEKPTRGMDAILPGLPIMALEARRFHKPTYVLVGDRDTLFNYKSTFKRAQHVLPGLRCVEIVPDSGHAMTFEYPDVVNGWILRFLNGG